MNAPDKLYLHGYPDKPFLCQDWDVSPTKRVVRGQQAENIAYIRKDALLEWAKETYLNENASAIRKVCYKQLIDKLNSI